MAQSGHVEKDIGQSPHPRGPDFFVCKGSASRFDLYWSETSAIIGRQAQNTNDNSQNDTAEPLSSTDCYITLGEIGCQQ